MYNPDNYLARVVGTFFVCQQIAFSSFVATLLCLYFKHNYLIFKLKIKTGSLPPWQIYIQLVSHLFFYFNLITTASRTAREKHIIVSQLFLISSYSRLGPFLLLYIQIWFNLVNKIAINKYKHIQFIINATIINYDNSSDYKSGKVLNCYQ